VLAVDDEEAGTSHLPMVRAQRETDDQAAKAVLVSWNV
jgi:hypothetical protein